MIRLVRFVFVSLMAIPAVTQVRSIEGLWMGTLRAGPLNLRLVLHVSKADAGQLVATMDSLDQGANGLKVDAIHQTDHSLHFELKMIGGSFDGAVNSDVSEIAGQWHQGGGSLPLTLRRIEKVPELARPQDPKKPYPYDEQEVSYENAAAGVKFAGTLTYPRGPGPFPAVLLITGSGPQNRNEEIMGHRPFLVLADFLTRHGLAVLRVDDRGVGGTSAGNVRDPTSEDFAGDALAGIDFLKTRKEVKASRIGLIGHSEGGLIAPMAAARSSDVAFMVMMAGSGYPGDRILIDQAALMAKAMGASPDAVDQNRSLLARLIDVLKSEPDRTTAAEKMRALWTSLPEDKRKAAGGDAAMDARINAMNNGWFRFFLTYDPATVLRKVKCPVLALNGANDLQVPPDNLPAIAAALEAGGNRDYEIVKLPGLNHLFQTSQTGSPTEYSNVTETISPLVLDLLARWIERQTSSR